MRTWKLTCLGCLFVLFASVGVAQTPEDTLRMLRPSFTDPLSAADVGSLLNAVAWRHRDDGWGLLRKTQGNICVAPDQGGVACDILTHRLGNGGGFVEHFDVLQDAGAGGANTPVWIADGLIDSTRFVAPIAVVVSPPPPPPPVLPSIDLGPVLTRLGMVDQALVSLSAKVDALQIQVATLTTEEQAFHQRVRDVVRDVWKNMLTYALPVVLALFGGKAL